MANDQSPRRRRFAGPRVPPNLFAIALGIAGLSQAWHAAVPVLGTPQAVPDALSILAALWLVLVGAYLAQGPRIILADLRDVPSALVPTMAIELGIPAVAGQAYFAVAGRTVSLVACVLGGYTVLMALVQVRLIPIYRRLSFTPGAWSFTFAYAAAAADALGWLAIKKPPGATGYAIAVIALLTAFVSWIAFRTVVLAVRGQLFPAWPPVHQAG